MISKNGMRFKFSPGEKVLCYEPDPTRSKVLYDSKVLELCISKDKRRKVPEYLIHFSGWSRSWDRCVTEEFILKDNQENRQLQNKLAEAAVGQAKSKKQRRKITAILKDSYRYSKKDDTLSSDVDSDRSKNSDDSDSDSSFDSASDTDQEEPEQEEQVMLTLKIPEGLKKKLEEDKYQIKKNNKLVRLPCEPTAIEILEGYVKTYVTNELCLTSDNRRSINKKEADISANINLCKESMDGLRIYLDFKINEALLYNEEQEQYTYFVNNYQPKCPQQTEISISSDKSAMIDARLGVKMEAKNEGHHPTPSVRGRRPRNSTDTNNSTRPLSPQRSRSPKSPGPKFKREVLEDADTDLPKRVLRSTAGKHEGSTHKSSADNSSNTTHGEKASTSKDSSEEMKECKTHKFGVRSQPPRQAAAIAEALILKSCTMARSGPSSPLPNTASSTSTTHSTIGETSSTRTSTSISLPTSTVTTRSHLSSISSCSSKSGPSSPVSVPVSSTAALKMTNALNEVMQFRMIPPSVYDQKPVPASLIYGAVHLLRLFVKLPDMVNQTNMPANHIQVLQSHLESFLSYLTQRQDELFPLSAYIDATDSSQMSSSPTENSNSTE